MNSDPLHDLLQNADEHFPAPRLREEIARRARRRIDRRCKVKSVAAIVLALLIVAPFARMMLPRHHSPTISSPPIGDDSSEIALIAQLTANDIIAQRKASEGVSRPSSIDPIITLHMELDQTAAILLAGGDHLMRDPTQKTAAAAEYRQARDLFPATPAAAVADQRLQQLGL